MRVVWNFECKRSGRNNVCGKFGFVLVTAWKYFSNKMKTRLVLHDEVRCELITFYTEYGTSHVLDSLSLLDSHVSFMGRCWEFRLSTLVAVCIHCNWMKDIAAKIDLFSGNICFGSVKPWTRYLPTEDLLFLFFYIAAQVSYVCCQRLFYSSALLRAR